MRANKSRFVNIIKSIALPVGLCLALTLGVKGIRGCERAPPEEIRKRKLQFEYKRALNHVAEQLFFMGYADRNQDNNISQEEYMEVLRRGGYNGRDLKFQKEFPPRPLATFQRAIQSYQEEKFKELDK